MGATLLGEYSQWPPAHPSAINMATFSPITSALEYGFMATRVGPKYVCSFESPDPQRGWPDFLQPFTTSL